MKQQKRRSLQKGGLALFYENMGEDLAEIAAGVFGSPLYCSLTSIAIMRDFPYHCSDRVISKQLDYTVDDIEGDLPCSWKGLLVVNARIPYSYISIGLFHPRSWRQGSLPSRTFWC